MHQGWTDGAGTVALIEAAVRVVEAASRDGAIDPEGPLLSAAKEFLIGQFRSGHYGAPAAVDRNGERVIPGVERSA
jgi:hypothetical protein